MGIPRETSLSRSTLFFTQFWCSLFPIKQAAQIVLFLPHANQFSQLLTCYQMVPVVLLEDISIPHNPPEIYILRQLQDQYLGESFILGVFHNWKKCCFSDIQADLFSLRLSNSICVLLECCWLHHISAPNIRFCLVNCWIPPKAADFLIDCKQLWGSR